MKLGWGKGNGKPFLYGNKENFWTCHFSCQAKAFCYNTVENLGRICVSPHIDEVKGRESHQGNVQSLELLYIGSTGTAEIQDESRLVNRLV